MPSTSAISVTDGKVFFSINVDAAEARAWENVRAQAEAAVRAIPGTDDDAYRRIHAVVSSFGAEVIAIPPQRHDSMVAVVSHIPHLTAATLMRLADDRATEHRALLRLAAGGFRDMTRIAASHLVVSRAGASTVAELSAIGRPAILVPLPHALDQDQFANAGVLEAAGAAIRVEQRNFTPENLAAEITALSNDPARLAHMAQAAKSAGTTDAADRLADLVLKVARN